MTSLVKPVGDLFRETAASGSLVLALPVALIAGLVSFFSPCVIPMLPGYLSYATGISGADLAEGQVRMQAGKLAQAGDGDGRIGRRHTHAIAGEVLERHLAAERGLDHLAHPAQQDGDHRHLVGPRPRQRGEHG